MGPTRTALRWTQHKDLAIRRTHTVPRDVYLAQMTFQRPGVPLFDELFGPIIGLKEEWLAQGASEAELDFSAFTYRVPAQAYLPVRTGRLGPFTQTVLEETDAHVLTRDDLGRTMRLEKGFATLPLPVDYPVRTMDDWRAIRPRYQFAAERLAGGWEDAARAAQVEGHVLAMGIPGGFDEPRQLLGEEGLCIAFYEDPELVHDILATLTATVATVLEHVRAAGIRFDVLNVHEDMAGKSGPLAGPLQIREFIAPYYRRAWDHARACGAVLFDQDSDGDMRPVIEPFLDAGVNCMHPVEPAAGMDIVALREQYGTRLAFRGGLDKHVLRRDHDAIRAELERKMPPLLRSGGCVLGLDHRIPNGTPLEAYRFYHAEAWRIIKRECGAN